MVARSYKQQFIIELCLAVFGAAILSVFFYCVDAIDTWYDFTRTHEDWELDEIIGIPLAFMIAAAILAVRYSFLLLKMNQQLEQANIKVAEHMSMQAHQEKLIALGQLSGGLAHEINNALQPVLGITQVARRRLKDIDVELYDALEIVEQSATHAASIVSEVLEFSKKNRSQNMKIQHGGALIKRSIDFAGTLLPQSVNIEFVKGYEPERVSVQVNADETNIKQVMINLLKNASEAMDGQGKITIRCGLQSPDDQLRSSEKLSDEQYLAVSIEDYGCGIDPAIQDKIFEPFFTTKSSYSRQTKSKGQASGTGLGLSTVYGLMRQHIGAISVKSEVGKGSIFTLYLPII